MICSLYFASFICLNIITCPIYEKENEIKTATFTAYTLSEDETDNSPCVGAGNHNLCIYKGRACASRTLPLHTIIKIEGIGECEILDRTSLKYADRIDILFPTKAEAFKFGKKTLEYKIIR